MTSRAASRSACMRIPSCTRGFTLATVMARRGLVLVAMTAALAAIPGGAAARPKAHLAAFPNCSRFVHYARRHALQELRTMGTPVEILRQRQEHIFFKALWDVRNEITAKVDAERNKEVTGHGES